jgi:uncharacterized membrane protein
LGTHFSSITRENTLVLDLIKQFTLFLAVGVEASAAFVIGFAAIEATLKAFKLFFLRRNVPEEAKEELRLRLGRWLAVALEFELAADILRTAVAPTWDEIGKLAAIVVLRTVLNFFLQKEIEKSAENKSNVRK